MLSLAAPTSSALQQNIPNEAFHRVHELSAQAYTDMTVPEQSAPYPSQELAQPLTATSVSLERNEAYALLGQHI
jgi:hypothetical protein